MKKLRLIEKEDLTERFKAINNPEISKWLMLPNVSLARTNNWFEKVIENPNRRDFVGLDNSKIFGFSGITNINNKDKSAEIFIFLSSKKFFSKGLSSWLLNEVMSYGFNEIGITRYYVKVAEKNIQSEKFFLKNGFYREGLLQKSVWYNGEFQNIILLAKITGNR
jgi:RimJ/RimL family protein N-acetyltransferase